MKTEPDSKAKGKIFQLKKVILILYMLLNKDKTLGTLHVLDHISYKTISISVAGFL